MRFVESQSVALVDTEICANSCIFAMSTKKILRRRAAAAMDISGMRREKFDVQWLKSL